MLNVKRNNNNKYVIENVSKAIFLVSALIAVVSLLLIIGFVFYKGLTPFLSKGYSFSEFFFGTKWIPSSDKFGILPMVLASIFGTLGSLVLGVPIGILTCLLYTSDAADEVQLV